MERAALAVATAVLGAGLGWSASALTLQGRVTAIEHSLQRIEQRLFPVVAEVGKP